MSEEPPRYLAYMLRVWQAGRSGSLTWRASLESPHTGERHSFTSMEALCAFLHERIGLDGPHSEGEAGAGSPETRDLCESPASDDHALPAPETGRPPSAVSGDGADNDA